MRPTAALAAAAFCALALPALVAAARTAPAAAAGRQDSAATLSFTHTGSATAAQATTFGPAAETPTPANPAATLDFLAIGDSLTRGMFAASSEDGYFARVAAWLGASGRPSAGSLAAAGGTVAATLAQAAAIRAEPARLVVIELGTNDARLDAAATPLPDFERDYRALVAVVRESSPGARLVLVGVWGQDAVRPGYDAVIRAVAADNNAAFVELGNLADDPQLRGPAGADTPLGVSDDFHPNSLGHGQIAQRLRLAIAPFYGLHAAPPRTAAARLPAWLAAPATLRLAAAPGSAPVARTFYRTGAGPWRTGTSVRVNANGSTTVCFYSVDRRGDMEPLRRRVVRIDRVAPQTQAAGAVTAGRGERVALGFSLADPWAPSCLVRLQVLRGARVVASAPAVRMAPGAGAVDWRCTLPRGAYRYRFTAVDLAGNPQSSAVAASLSVR